MKELYECYDSANYFKGSKMKRRTMMLVVKLALVALGHIGLMFTIYGTRVLRSISIPSQREGLEFAGIILSFAFILIPTAIALFFYHRLITRSNLLSGPRGRAIGVACSIAASLISLYCAMFLCLNTFGE